MKEKIRNFFKVIWNAIVVAAKFIAKYFMIAYKYVVENAWIQPLVIVGLIFALIFGLQGIINGVTKLIDQITSGQVEKNFTKITMEELNQKLENNEDFTFFIGYEACSACQKFYPVVNKYVSTTGNKIYYLDVESNNGVYTDYTLEQSDLDEFVEKLKEITHRSELASVESISTPTTIVVRGGEFVDAKVGAVGFEDASEYLDFIEFVEGRQVQ